MRLFAALVSPIRRSLRVRVSLTVLAISSVLLLIVGMVLINSIQRGIFETRLKDVLREAIRATDATQQDFDAAPVGSPLAAYTLASDAVRSVLTQGSSAIAVAFLPPSTSQAGAVSAIHTDQELSSLASAELINRAEFTGEQVWQSVGLPQPAGGVEPGLVVAKVVRLSAINYVLVLVYDISAEQTIMALIARIILISAAAMLVVLVLVTYVATRQAVRPVKDAAVVASRLADGALSERMQVRGQTEMATLAASFNAMATSMQRHIEDMENLSKLQRRFVADVSHELRTPLATIRMAGDLLYQARGHFDPEVARSAELLAGQLDRFEALLSDLLEISRLDAGAAGLDLEPTDLCVVVAAALDSLDPLARQAGTELRRHLPATPCQALIDRRRVDRIVRNLVANAIVHAQAEVTEIFVAGNAQAVAIVVRDHGVGLATGQIDRVFDRFWRADPARSPTTTGGTGLGLAIALEDAKAHGGRIDVWSEAGNGTSFRLVLPTDLALPAEPPAPIDLDPQPEEVSTQ